MGGGTVKTAEQRVMELARQKRFRSVAAKPRQLVARWGRVDGELAITYTWGGQGAQKADARILMRALEDVVIIDGKTLAEELEARGYDLTTLRFSVSMHQPKDSNHE